MHAVLLVSSWNLGDKVLSSRQKHLLVLCRLHKLMSINDASGEAMLCLLWLKLVQAPAFKRRLLLLLLLLWQLLLCLRQIGCQLSHFLQQRCQALSQVLHVIDRSQWGRSRTRWTHRRLPQSSLQLPQGVIAQTCLVDTQGRAELPGCFRSLRAAF